MCWLSLRFAVATRSSAAKHCAVVWSCLAMLSVAACATTVRRSEPPPVKVQPPQVEVEPPPVKAELAQQDTQASVISFHGDAAGVDFTPWIAEFVAHLKRNWHIPSAPSSLKGHVAVAFKVHRDGRITDVVLERASGITSFDEASSRTVAACNPTLPLPSAYVREYAMFTVTFNYNELPPKQEACGQESAGPASLGLQPTPRCTGRPPMLTPRGRR